MMSGQGRPDPPRRRTLGETTPDHKTLTDAENIAEQVAIMVALRLENTTLATQNWPGHSLV